MRVILLLLLAVFMFSCEENERLRAPEDIYTLANYFEKYNSKELQDIIVGYRFRAGIIYDDGEGGLRELTYRGCYDAFRRDFKNPKFAKQFCNFLMDKALKEVLKERREYVAKDLQEFLKTYQEHLKVINETNRKLLKYSFYALVVAGIVLGLLLAYLLYIVLGIRRKRKKAQELLEKARQEYQEIIDNAKAEKEKILSKAQEEYAKIIELAQKEADEIIGRKKEEVALAREKALREGYEEGIKMAKQELKALRNRIAAIKSLFRVKVELDECFKKVMGIPFEKWLKRR